MKQVIVCLACLSAVTGSALAHDTKKQPVVSVVEEVCSGASTKKKNFDCGSTGTVSLKKLTGTSNPQPEPRLGFHGNPWITTGF